jgi:peptidoglycan-associated lipoprotein
MMMLHKLPGTLGVAVMLMLVAAGCAKRPATAAVSAPSPAPPATPVTARPSLSEFVEIPELRDVYFDLDKFAIRPDAVPVLQANLAWLKTHASALVLIEGHCDERGTDADNLALGERRANAVRDYLVERGIAAERITVISYGEARPACVARTQACWARNRRAHFLATIR